MGNGDTFEQVKPVGYLQYPSTFIPNPNNVLDSIFVYEGDLRNLVYKNVGGSGEPFVQAWQTLLSSFDPATRAAIYNQSVTDKNKPIFAPGYWNEAIMGPKPEILPSIVQQPGGPKLQTQAPGGMVIAPNPNAPRVPSASQPGKPPGTLPATATAAGSNMTALYWIAGGVAAFFLAKKARIF
jgi:hypothetical protein